MVRVDWNSDYVEFTVSRVSPKAGNRRCADIWCSRLPVGNQFRDRPPDRGGMVHLVPREPVREHECQSSTTGPRITL